MAQTAKVCRILGQVADHVEELLLQHCIANPLCGAHQLSSSIFIPAGDAINGLAGITVQSVAPFQGPEKLTQSAC